MNRPFPPPAAAALLLVVVACGDRAASPAGSPELRGALFDTILARTARREAFSAIKQQALRFDPLADMAALRGTVINAANQEDLFYALARLSNARRDRHLTVGVVPHGLGLANTDGLSLSGADPATPRQAALKVLPDYGETEPAYFVSDVPAGGDGTGPRPGERIVSVNGRSMASWEAAVTPYIPHSSRAGLRWKAAEALPQRTALLPPSLHHDDLLLETERADGSRTQHRLPYLDPASLVWTGTSEPRYPGFTRERGTGTYDLYLPNDRRPVVILVWHGFRETLVADVDSLVAVGRRLRLLDHALIVDATRSRGGSLGPYAVQRLQPRRFKTTFGTLRLSDVIDPFIADRLTAFEQRRIADGGVPETIDDGTWLLEWLQDDVRRALARGDSVTRPVPFKLAHAPRHSDGWLSPAPAHFRGPLVVFSGPHGGSHLDQFVSIVVDNTLGHVIGMPAGGYSNTWEWEETLTFPGTDRPVMRFMWSIGHTIRPNGEVLEGNPAAVHELVPLTRANFAHYYRELYRRALAHFASLGHPAGS